MQEKEKKEEVFAAKRYGGCCFLFLHPCLLPNSLAESPINVGAFSGRIGLPPAVMGPSVSE